ncbi:MAG TPA: DinB family protein [Candidatus Dormibacteraeota bacterium]
MALEPSVATYYSGWENYQRMLAGAIAPLDDEQLNLRAAPHLWSVRMLANHIVATRAWWFHSYMREGGPEFDAIADFDEGEESERRPAAEIVKGLEATWLLVDSSLRRWSEADLDARFQRPVPNAEGERPWRDRRYIIWHVAEHDLHHGGELSFSLGMHGIPALDL